MEYTEEQLNYFRVCYIAFNLVPKGLRKVFKQEWDFRYKSTPLGEWKDTLQNGLDFVNNESRKSRTKNARYLTAIQNGDTEEWDCSCLFFAILFSDSVGTSLSPAINYDVDNLRQVRNDIAHASEAELADVYFKNYVARVLFAFISLGLPINQIEAVKNQTTFPTEEVANLKKQVDNLNEELTKAKSDLQAAQNTIQTKEEQVESLTQEINFKVTSFCHLTFRPSHEIIIRQNDVTRIVDKMKELEDGSNGAISTVYLSGSPGCGKSQIARQVGSEEYLRKTSRDSEALTFVATLDAESLETLTDSYITLAKQLGMTEYALTNFASSREENAKEKLQQLKLFTLSKAKAFSKWLLIADNVVDLSLVRSYLPETGNKEWGQGQVLITTQDASAIPTDASHTYHASLSQGMQPEDAVELLRNVSHISNQVQAEEVAEILEFQPLSLAAAAFYVRTVVRNGSPDYSWTKYLKSLEQGKREATEEPLAKGSMAYSKTMTTAVKLALNHAIEADEVLRHTFSFLQLCAPEALPIQAAVDFVESRTTGQTEELIRAKILKSSFILSSCEQSEATRVLRVHNIVHEVLQTMTLTSSSTGRFETTAAAIRIFKSLIDKEIALSLHEGYTYAQLRTIALHCKSLLENISGPDNLHFPVQNMKPFISTENVLQWVCSTADVCRKLSDPSRAIFFSNLALNLLSDFANSKQTEKLMTAQVYTVHGKVLSLHCEPELSISYHEKALRILDAIQGKDKLNITITNYHSLGRLYKAIGQHNEAKEFLEKALEICKSISGEDNIYLATSYNHLGLIYNDMGQYKQAKEFHEKALIIRKKALGEEHGDVAASYNNLGLVAYNLGLYKQAEEFHEKALIIRKKVFGEEHCDVSASYNNLGLVFYKCGKYLEAKELHEKALKIRRKVFGEEHGDVLGSYNNLGLAFYKYGQSLHSKEFDIIKDIALRNAYEMHEKALRIGKQLFGKKPWVAASYNNLGLVSYTRGKYAEAKKFYERALSIRRETFGEEHREVAASYNNLGLAADKLRDYKQAKEFHEKALAIRKKVFGEKHVDVAASYNNLGVAFHNLRQYNEAKTSHDKALIIRMEIFGANHHLVAQSYDNLGSAIYNLEQYHEAQECNKKAIIIRQRVFGEEHHLTASSYEKLGFICSKLGQESQAQKSHMKAKEIRRKICGLAHNADGISLDSALDYHGGSYFIGFSAEGTYSTFE